MLVISFWNERPNLTVLAGASPFVPFDRASTKATKAWLTAYKDRPKPVSETVATIAAVEEESECPAKKAEKLRQPTLDGRTVQILSSAQIIALHFLVASFFFLCRIPFSVIEHYASKALIKGLCPAYAASLCGRTALSTTYLDKVYAETK